MCFRCETKGHRLTHRLHKRTALHKIPSDEYDLFLTLRVTDTIIEIVRLIAPHALRVSNSIWHIHHDYRGNYSLDLGVATGSSDKSRLQSSVCRRLDRASHRVFVGPGRMQVARVCLKNPFDAALVKLRDARFPLL
jgi:hypothetical protein